VASARKPKKRAARISISDLLSVINERELAARSGATIKQVRAWKKSGAPASERKRLSSIVISERERIESEAVSIAKEARRGKRIPKPADAPGFNRSGKQETRRYEGRVRNVRGKQVLVTERTKKQIVYDVLRQAKRMKRGSGRYFATFSLVEFGTPTGSGGKKLKTVSRGKLGGMSAYQTFASTDPDYGQGGKRGAVGLPGLEAQVRALLDRMGDDPRTASVIDNFTVKRYRQKTDAEIEDWRKGRG
jgi:hypothetical protein